MIIDPSVSRLCKCLNIVSRLQQEAAAAPSQHETGTNHRALSNPRPRHYHDTNSDQQPLANGVVSTGQQQQLLEGANAAVGGGSTLEAPSNLDAEEARRAALAAEFSAVIVRANAQQEGNAAAARGGEGVVVGNAEGSGGGGSARRSGQEDLNASLMFSLAQEAKLALEAQRATETARSAGGLAFPRPAPSPNQSEALCL